MPRLPNTEFQNQCTPVDCAGTHLWLHPEKVMYWPAANTLLVADVHLGKEHAFNRAGIPIPAGPSASTLARLMRLVDQSHAERLIVLGDFMHTAPATDEPWLNALTQALDERPQLKMHIVAGNHDKTHGQPRIDHRVQWHNDAWIESPFVLQHEPDTDRRGYVLSGHIHPACRIGTRQRSSLRAPVFWFGKDVCVMPAFGEFTGGKTVYPEPEDTVYLALPDGVIKADAIAQPRRYRRKAQQ